MGITDLRSHIAIVPQDCVLFNDTVMYNIAYGAIREPDIQEIIDDKARGDQLIERIVPAAKRASIHKFIMEKNMGYWELVGERGLKLSGGEKQRVAIARALLKSTPIMCFDEATSALDTETEREVQKAINEVSQGSTTLIIAHRLSTVRECDKIIVMKLGEIVEQGSHDELLKMSDGYYKRLWEKQSEQQARMLAEAQEKEKAAKELEEALE
jgi:ATP-binding cassette, subfamily B, heavy metal transporter